MFLKTISKMSPSKLQKNDIYDSKLTKEKEKSSWHHFKLINGSCRILYRNGKIVFRWDVQRIHELRRNERLKERLRRRKSRWNKMESPQQQKTEISDLITSLFPNIRTIEKIIITDSVPVTALGTSIPKIPSWWVIFLLLVSSPFVNEHFSLLNV